MAATRRRRKNGLRRTGVRANDRVITACSSPFSVLRRALSSARDGLALKWKSGLLLFIGFALAFSQLFADAWAIERFWLKPSEQVVQDRVEARTMWGGSTTLADHPDRVSLDNDSYYVISYAREMAERGEWRLRHSDIDNAPWGREMHWSSAVMWQLIVLAWGRCLFTGESMHSAIASVSVFASPLLLVVVLLSWSVLIARRMGAGMAVVFAITLSSLPSILWDFGYGRPTHHGFHLTSAISMMLGLILGGGGWTRAEDNADAAWARRFFTVSGLAAGMQLWIGATQEMFILGAVGLGAMLLSLTVPQGGRWEQVQERLAKRVYRFNPLLWRNWGRTGAAASIVFYLIEYFPNHFSMRLEVNSPLHALMLLAGGELIYLVGRWRCARSSFPWKRAAINLIGVSVLPAALIFGPRTWHAWHDPYMRRLHDYIVEFLPIAQQLGDRPWYTAITPYGGLCLLVFASPIAYCWRGQSPAHRAVILPPFMAVLITAVMVTRQARWTGLLSASLLCLLVATLPAVWNELEKWRGGRGKRIVFTAIAVPLIVPSLLLFWNDFYKTHRLIADGISPPQLTVSIAARDVAFNLRRYSHNGIARVLCGPSDTPSLFYFGGSSGVGALYWEDIAGVRDEADFWSDYGEEDAKRIVRERGITHIVCEQNPALADYMHYVKFGTHEEKDLARTMAYRLSSPLGDIPDWLEPLPYYASPAANSVGKRIYRVLPQNLK